ncbi:MAG TPA: molecular chaperone HtpG [Cyanobacteria bacterium UBA8530]|nr:molecular chaperone HtpG [Cyanobacteria bacterium UBA8530]
MSTETGQISIHTENILPIIKQWLYSDKEIFLRELISNAVDAITKVKKVALSEEIEGNQEYSIQVELDQEKGTLSIRDNGIGMDEGEIKKYINQIAFSGAEDFLERYKENNENNQIIGHFGLGFYSAFMVAEKVEIVSKSYRKGSVAAHWSCEGGTEYLLEESEKEERGTEVILTISPDCAEFLDRGRITEIIKRYCNFLPVPILLNGELQNERTPIWTRTPNTIKEEEYKEFYKKHFPGKEDPLFWIHLNVDYPFRLQGILYFPKILHELDGSKGEVQLYCNQVYVSDNTQDLIPKFLTVLQGMIDCPDIPLNVSRSMLQNDPYVRKISEHITKKIASRLKALYQSDKEQYQRLWEDIHLFIKFGAMEHEKFYEAVKDFLIFKSSEGGYLTLDQYLEKNKEKNKDVVFYFSDEEKQSTYLNLFKSQGLEALNLSSMIDNHFIQFLEFRRMPLKFQRIDSQLTDNLIDSSSSKGDEKNIELLSERIKELLEIENIEVKVESLKSEAISAVIVQPEYARRFKEMAAFMQKENAPDVGQTLIVNQTNTVVQRFFGLDEEGKVEESKLLLEQIYDLARLAHNGLKGDEMTRFLERSHGFLGKI